MSKETKVELSVADPAKVKDLKAEKSAREMVDYLRETGTGATRLKLLEDRVKPGMTAKELFGFMVTGGIPLGTLEKAGKWLYGPHYAPESGLASHPTEEVEKLRVENESLKRQLELALQGKVSLEAQLQIARKTVGDLSAEVTALKKGRTADELALIGIT